MPLPVRLPDLGEGLEEGEVVRWLVAPGEVVGADQPLVVVLTDKATTELPSPVAGRVVRLAAAPGERVPVGALLLELEPLQAAPGEAPAAPPAVAAPRAGTPSGGAGTASTAAPAVRRLARELGVALETVRGTGPGGRKREDDVRRAAAAAADTTAPPPPRRIPLRGVRRAAAEHLARSREAAIPFTLVEEVDFTELVRLRRAARAAAAARGFRLTYLPFLCLAASRALRDHPQLNATVEEESGDLLVHARHDFSVAVDTEAGLLAPVLPGVEHRTLLELAGALEQLAVAARVGGLAPEQLRGGTFTITSPGRLGGRFATPVLNAPQVAILGLHRIEPRPAVRRGRVVPRALGCLSLTLDHRYVDGRAGGAFLATLRGLLQRPALLLLESMEGLHGASPEGAPPVSLGEEPT